LVTDDTSIFTLQYDKGLASVGGMTLVTSMVAFMIVVDRIQVWVEHSVEHDECMKTFMERVNIELMVRHARHSPLSLWSYNHRRPTLASPNPDLYDSCLGLWPSPFSSRQMPDSLYRTTLICNSSLLIFSALFLRAYSSLVAVLYWLY